MLTHTVAKVLKVAGDDVAGIETALDAAVLVAQEHAMKQGRHGVLVTQHGFNSYTVTVSDDVPFGQTHERRQWRSMSGDLA
jgi:hypothetical protein